MPISDSQRWAADTSFAIAALDPSHPDHAARRRVAMDLRPALAGHATFETFSVLTRLPGSQRVLPADAAELLTRAFPDRCWLGEADQTALLGRFRDLNLAGGSVYDALVAEAARVNGRRLLSADLRARRTYAAVGVDVEFVN